MLGVYQMKLVVHLTRRSSLPALAIDRM
jgi:hypothetical protein